MKLLACIVFSVISASSSLAQATERADTASNVYQLIKNQQFQFIARSANPIRGQTIFLSAGYRVTILSDSVISDLPFYGRAYQAPMNPGESGFKFTSTDFTYAIKERKKGSLDVLIKTKDVKNAPQMSLFVGKDGNASLRVISTDRAVISYAGYIREISN